MAAIPRNASGSSSKDSSTGGSWAGRQDHLGGRSDAEAGGRGGHEQLSAKLAQEQAGETVDGGSKGQIELGRKGSGEFVYMANADLMSQLGQGRGGSHFGAWGSAPDPWENGGPVLCRVEHTRRGVIGQGRPPRPCQYRDGRDGNSGWSTLIPG
jgi:hypothetical protein